MVHYSSQWVGFIYIYVHVRTKFSLFINHHTRSNVQFYLLTTTFPTLMKISLVVAVGTIIKSCHHCVTGWLSLDKNCNERTPRAGSERSMRVVLRDSCGILGSCGDGTVVVEGGRTHHGPLTYNSTSQHQHHTCHTSSY